MITRGELKKISEDILKKYIELLEWLKKKSPELMYSYPEEIVISKIDEQKYNIYIVVNYDWKYGAMKTSGNYRILNMFEKESKKFLNKYNFITGISTVRSTFDELHNNNPKIRIKINI